MATENAGGESSAVAEEESDRPQFRGCVVCYTAEWAAYAVRRLR